MLLAIFIFSISTIVRKISPFEVPKVVIYWVLDDRITYIYQKTTVPAIYRPYGFGRVFGYLKALSAPNGRSSLGAVTAVQYHNQKTTKS